jgi:hypothetical protein
MTRFILPNTNRNGIPSFVGAIGSGTLNQSLIIFREKLTHIYIYITGGVNVGRRDQFKRWEQ